MVGRFFSIISRNIDMDYLIRAGIVGAIHYFGGTLDNYNKRREVGFKIIESLGGAFDESNRKVMANFKGEDFQEDRKVIEFIK